MKAQFTISATIPTTLYTCTCETDKQVSTVKQTHITNYKL